VGDSDAQRRQLEAMKSTVRADVYGRFHMSRERLDELIGVLQQTATNYDRALEELRSARGAEEGR
jgi:hypothetical protein